MKIINYKGKYLYMKSKGELSVFLDRFCLPDGQDWEKSFLKGLEGSSVIVLLISKLTLEGMLDNVTKKKQDNVLLEWEYAAECARTRGVTVFSILVSTKTETKTKQKVFEKFDAWSLVASFPDEYHASPKSPKKLTVKELVQWVFKHQGVHVDAEFYITNMSQILRAASYAHANLKRHRTQFSTAAQNMDTAELVGMLGEYDNLQWVCGEMKAQGICGKDLKQLFTHKKGLRSKVLTEMLYIIRDHPKFGIEITKKSKILNDLANSSVFSDPFEASILLKTSLESCPSDKEIALITLQAFNRYMWK